MTPQAEPDPTDTLPPGQTRINHILRWGTEHAAITQAIPRLDITHFTLRLDGDVAQPVRLRWSELLRYPTVTQSSDFHCVEGWSVIACAWTGVPLAALVDVVQPRPQACFVTFHGADGYTTSLPWINAVSLKALLAYRLDGEPLPPELGGPLRCVVPQKYAYKSAMWVTKIIFSAKETVGYWERTGYSQTADVWTNDRYSPEQRHRI